MLKSYAATEDQALVSPNPKQSAKTIIGPKKTLSNCTWRMHLRQVRHIRYCWALMWHRR